VSTALAFLPEVEQRPALLGEWLTAFSAADPVTLALYAPGCDKSEAAARVHAVLDSLRRSADEPTAATIVVLPLPDEGEQLEALAARVDALYSDYPDWYFREHPRIGADGRLREQAARAFAATPQQRAPFADLDQTGAWGNLKADRFARWNPRHGADPRPDDDRTAVRRLGETFFTPLGLERTFTLRRTHRVYAIGSCFAREIEKALARRGLAIESLSPKFEAMAEQFGVAGGSLKGGSPLGFTNKHNPLAILHDLQWALDPATPFPAEALIPLEDGTYADPHTPQRFPWADLPETLRRRRIVTDVTRRIAGCRLVVITLGLIESWFDTHTGLYTNVTPQADARDPDRFRFHVLGYEQVRDALAETHALLTAYGHPDVQIVVSTSPVPLEATFTGQDVVTANTHSKALLRLSAAEWTAQHENVHYFPSYEIALNSEREAAWWPDLRHVRPELAEHITDLFCATHLEP
jgi:hypothetical protein